MSDLPSMPEPDVDPEEMAQERPSAMLPRNGDLLGRAGAPVRDVLDKLFGDIAKGFEDQSTRADAQQDYWDCYNCQPNQHRYYNGIAEIYFPIIHDAVEARATRFTNQLFPQSDRYVDCTAADGSMQWDMIALTEHYLKAESFKTDVAMPLCRNGDVEGQYNLYVDWMEVSRQLVSRETRKPIDRQSGMEIPVEEHIDIIEEDVVVGSPVFEVLHDADVLVLPQTADSVEKALAEGGVAVIVRRWTKAKLEQMVDDGLVRKDVAATLKIEMGRMEDGQGRDTASRLLEHVGIRKGGKELTVWEAWTMLPLKDGRYSEKGERRLCRVFFGPHRTLMGLKRNPYWNDRCPLLSRPVIKEAGVFKGPSLIKYVESLQYEANDAVNEGADAATYSAMPIVAVDPEKYNGPLVYNMAAVWQVPPGSIQMQTFPDMTPRAQVRVQMALSAIFQTLGVNPSMLPQQTGKPGAKRNQAEVAMEQSVDLLTTAMAVSTLEDMFTQNLAWIVDLDYQFRDREIAIREFGEMGLGARMQAVAPLLNRNGITFVWRGGEQVRQNMAMMQGGTAWLNVLRGLRQDLAQEGVTLKLAPIVEAGTRNLFGPVLGARVIEDQRSQLTIGADEENAMMADGFEVMVHPLDDDKAHIMKHHQSIVTEGDPHGTKRAHLQAQLHQAQMKMQAQMAARMAQQMQGGQPGPRGPAAAPRGTPPGAVPTRPRQLKGPPGMIHPDAMPRAGGIGMPRKM